MTTRNHLVSMGVALTLMASNIAADGVKIPHGGLTLNANLEATGPDWQKGPVVLMTHGRLAHAGMEIMQGLQTALKDRGVSSLAITLSLGLDNRQGMYPCATPHTHRHTDAVDEIGAWLGWLQSQGVTKPALLGHSSGGNQVARFASDRPNSTLSALVLLGPQAWSAEAAAQDYEKRYGKPLAGPLERAEKLVADGKGGALLERVDFLYCADAPVSAAAFVSYYAPDERTDTPRLIPQTQVPVLVIAGSKDEVMQGLVEKVKPLADGRRVQLKVIDGADHFFRDLYTEDVADAIQVMLAGG
jgi:pimeloyl-ACP methyl ester carboxylesterase